MHFTAGGYFYIHFVLVACYACHSTYWRLNLELIGRPISKRIAKRRANNFYRLCHINFMSGKQIERNIESFKNAEESEVFVKIKEASDGRNR